MPNPLAADLDHVLDHTRELWEEFRATRVFITGGTGFFGCWLLESFIWANDRLGLDAQALILTRAPGAFQRKAPHLASHPAIHFHTGDVRSFDFPTGSFSHVIHAATESASGLNESDPLAMLDVIVEGTRRTLDFAITSGAKKFLLASSGAVYGRQPPEITHLPETYAGAPDPTDPRSAYGEGKRMAELLCAIYHHRHGLDAKIARCWALVGPYMPFDSHFAIGNFIRNALDGRPIRVKGDGTPQRSYIYAAELAVWLWTILVAGAPCHPYNVGSETAITIAELAALVPRTLGRASEVVVEGTATASNRRSRYVPSAERARAELNLTQTVPVDEAIRRTAKWESARRVHELISAGVQEASV